MNRIASLVVLVLAGLEASLGAEATCLGCHKSNGPQLELDFEGLSEYLAGKIETDDSAANLGKLRAGLVSLEPEAVRRAAELTVKLFDASQCDDEALVLIKQAQEAGLRVNGGGRVEKAIEGHLSKLLNSCVAYINDSLGQRLQSAKIAEFFNIAGEKSTEDKNYLRHLLSRNAKDDPNVQCMGVNKKARDQFDSIFDTYLARPCQELVPLFGPIAEGYSATVYIHAGYSAVEAFKNQLVSGRKLFKTMEVCQDVLNMTASKKTKMWKKFCGPTGLKAQVNTMRWKLRV